VGTDDDDDDDDDKLVSNVEDSIHLQYRRGYHW